MKIPHIKTIIIALLYFFAACTPYNSNEVNTKLIQGKWQLKEAELGYTIYDTVSIDYANEPTYLIFNGKECMQYMPDWDDTLKLNFTIRDYKLILYQDSLLINSFDIDTLTNELLTLSHKKSERVYKKIQ